MASSFSRARDGYRLASRKCSTAQVCLHRILHTIATCPNSSGSNGCLGVDLALRLGSARSCDDAEELLIGASDLTIEKTSENLQERAEGSEATDGEGAQRVEGASEQRKVSGHGYSEDRPPSSNFDGLLGLLVEAARWVSGGFEDGGDSESEGQSRGEDGHGEVGESQGPGGGGEKALGGEFGDPAGAGAGAATVERRSERGRKRVMPFRYRDSVLEPYRKRLSPPRRTRRMSGPRRSR